MSTTLPPEIPTPTGTPAAVTAIPPDRLDDDAQAADAQTPHDSMGDAADGTDPDWDELDDWDDPPWWASDWAAVLVTSIVAHLIVVLTLALVRLHQPVEEQVALMAAKSENVPDPVNLIDTLQYSDDPEESIGADSLSVSEAATATAIEFAEIAEIPSPVDTPPVDFGQVIASEVFSQPVAPMQRLTNQKGKVGEGTQGAAGAIDRITFEILKSMEERPTLVAWLFDQSGSLHRQRQQIIGRFDRIYEELGIVQENDERFKERKGADVPLLTSIVGFGQTVQLYNEKPSDDLGAIKQIINSINVDSSGVERVFTAVEEAANEFKRFRRNTGDGPARNVIFIVVTDERGDDAERLERAIGTCRRYAIPVHVIGVPAPFGREHTYVKYVDPDPRFDQSARWAEVDQGPETLLPERVQVGFTGDFQQEPTVDSGFGPYALTRLCYETGGIYFTVHPNRNMNRAVYRGEVDPYASDLRYFFDPDVMSRYRPDYLSPKDYLEFVRQSPLRQALVQAARMKPAQGIDAPRTRFVKRNDAGLVADLTRAQQDAAKLEPTLLMMAQTLMPGMEHRSDETSPRWQAGFDLAMGRVLAQKVRTETYNAMLAKAKRGMAFSDAKNNTWVLKPADEITVGSRWQREAETAKTLLQSVVDNHPKTPWALLASQELSTPIGWQWTEQFTAPDPPRPNRPGNNNPNPRPPRDDQARMLQKAPTRPIPKL
ncbi:hypothetical protein V7x_28130 [Crateriforma conspicua]|uniref:VWFA domain-containing protein n=1 Tax=Crateriforma conspicua TaxID=2527996 RepID=A0A5C6G180_9PLAN|nr:vWA domain-containing protein [Crateriforma conspicua]TWU67240.1 hypothetical protein V7x_28130 [Crateriforma conspicua]